MKYLSIVIAGLFMAMIFWSGPVFANPILNSVQPPTVVVGERVTLTGTFIAATDKIRLEIDGQAILLEPEQATASNAQISFVAPVIAIGAVVKVSVEDNAGAISNDKYEILICGNLSIREAVIWKKAGMPETNILAHVSLLAEKDLEGERSGKKPVCSQIAAGRPQYFNGVRILGNDLNVLKAANFTDDFVARLEGQKQYVTLGLSAVYFREFDEVATAPILRILLVPRSYYQPREPLLTTRIFSKSWWTGLKESLDVNVGYTVMSNNAGGTETSDNYLLVGFSYEMNRSAFLNFGQAIPVNNDNAAEKTWYWGITVDQNFFKAMGLMN
ncbi:MAG: IPT/TIG domain-containing protein [Proteobacteria bacterium]|nr:IPT/TIG domain-containing protein [Pseudomonadota bacterium]MBU1688759.1 IPT/TIG domain-containing protein [Pseudomonadota bacterium]